MKKLLLCFIVLLFSACDANSPSSGGSSAGSSNENNTEQNSQPATPTPADSSSGCY